jgi:parvulin-like peptidyl-prolyl isomerase
MPMTVNGKPVNEDALYAEFSNIKSYFESLGNVSCCERDDEFRGYAKQNMVARMLLAEEAERRMAAPAEAEIDAAIEAMKQEQGEFQFAAMVATSPGQLEGIRQDVSTNLRVQKLLNELWQDVGEPSEQDLREFYEKNKASFMTAEEVRASHISKNPGRGENREVVYQELREVRRKLLAGEDFDELARQHSDKGKEQIDLGFFKRGDLPEEFELVAFSMDVGELSPVFPSTYGYHIARVTDRRPPQVRAFDEIRDSIRQLVIEERRKARTQALVDELKATARIEDTPAEAEGAPAHVHS